MKKAIIFTVFFLIVIALSVQAITQNEVATAEEMTLDLTIKGELEIEKETETGTVNSIQVELFLVPKEEQWQHIEEMLTTPNAEERETTYLFTWDDPTDPTFSLEAAIEMQKNYPKITNAVSFPVRNVPEEVQEYLQETEMIDYTHDDIEELANDLAEGETDLYVVATKMAAWVNQNVTYNLTTLTAQAAEPASWVLENRYGVCDELTNLYIALLRAVGVPARFVVGVSYTDSPLFATQWNSHGWAEVYFPNYGWVPFDITYGQYGYADAGHIVLQYGTDADLPSVKYSWSGRNVQVLLKEIIIDVEGEEIGEKEEGIEIQTENYADEVGFDSWNYVVTTIKNDEDFYRAVQLEIETSEGIQAMEDKKIVLLKPHEEKNLFWLVHIEENLDPKYEYGFKIIFVTETGESLETTIKANKAGNVYKEETIRALIAAQQEEEEKVYSKEVDLACDTNEKRFYPEEQEEQGKIECIVENKGNKRQEITICFEGKCRETILNIGAREEFILELSEKDAGVHTSIVEVQNEEITKSQAITYYVLDMPAIEIGTIELQETAAYGEEIPIRIELEKISVQNPRNVMIEIEYGNKRQEIAIDELTATETVESTIDTADFRAKNTEIKITVQYEDEYGKEWQKEEARAVALNNISFFTHLKILILGIIGL